MPKTTPNIPLITLSALILLLVYIFQHFDYYMFFAGLFGISPSDLNPETTFIFNKTLRFFVNDTIMLAVIWSLFREMKFLKLAVFVELFGLLILLPIYFILKLSLEGTSEISSPLLSFLHRLIINPILMLLLIPAFLYQKRL